MPDQRFCRALGLGRPVPADDEPDQVPPAGDMSIFADLSLEELELRAVAADLWQLTASDLVAYAKDHPGKLNITGCTPGLRNTFSGTLQAVIGVRGGQELIMS